MLLKFIFTATSIALLTGCASLNSVSLTPIPNDRTSPVKTEKSKIIFLGFNFDNDFVDETVVHLKQQCPNGKITGILTKDETINYFFFIIWEKRITATGFCLSANGSKPKKRIRDAASIMNNPGDEVEL